MPDVSAETEKTRAEVADYLREFADELSPPETERASTDRTRSSEASDTRPADDRSAGGKVTVIVGNESSTINPPEMLLFGVEVDTDGSLLGASDERGVTFSLTWSERDVEPDEEFAVE